MSRRKSEYKLVAFDDGSTAIVSAHVELGRALFKGTMTACLRKQNEMCSPHDGLLILKSASLGKAKAAIDVVALIEAVIQCGLTIRPLERQPGLEDRKYDIVAVTQRLGSQDVFVLLDDGNVYRFFDAASDRYLFVVCGS